MNVGCAVDCSNGGGISRSGSSNATSSDAVTPVAPRAESTASPHLLFLTVVLIGLWYACAP